MARAEIRHTNPLECSDCKNFACGKNLVGWQADYLHARASEMYFELFISDVEKQPAIWDPRNISI